MAEKLGVSRQTIISIEKGKYDPSLPLAFEIAKTFQTTIEHVFIYEGKEEGNKDELFTKVLRYYGNYFSIYEWIYDINRYNDAFCTTGSNVYIACDDDYVFLLKLLTPAI